MQLVQLQEAQKELKALGYGVAAISYDSPDILKEFAKRKSLTVPLISDPKSEWLASAGLKNTEGEGLSDGVALPATLIVDKSGKVTHLFKESAYQNRITPSTLVHILKTGQRMAAQETELPKETVVTPTHSESSVTNGSIFVVSVTVALPENHHAYGPKAEGGVIPMSLTFEDHPLLEVVRVDYPEAHTQTLLGETYPVYEGVVTVDAFVKVRHEKETRDQLPDLVTLPLKANLEYQICTDTLCLAPQDKALQWILDYRPLDSERSPEAIQHP